MTALLLITLECDGLPDDPDGCPYVMDIETGFDFAGGGRDWASHHFGWQSDGDIDICDRCAKRDAALAPAAADAGQA